MKTMSSPGKTKNRILDLLKQGSKRMTDIKKELDLSGATVSQHLKELAEMNLIIQQASHFKTEKYYKAI